MPRLRFLIHPRFIVSVHQCVDPTEVAYWLSLFKRYERKVSDLEPDSLLVAILQLEASEANQNKMLEWQMDRLARTLGERVVLFDSTVQMFRKTRELMDLIPNPDLARDCSRMCNGSKRNTKT